MIPDSWSEIKEKFQAALDMQPDERAAYLRQLEAIDPDIRQEVESLLASYSQAGESFLNFPEPQRVESDLNVHRSAMIGRRIGSYRIVEWIGAGGMGEVYRAVRADEQYEKQVALKLVRGGPNSDFVIRRFKNERQILASLEHPNIARMFDGGTTEDGVPYFVIELIEGQPIDEYCDAHGLSVSERLTLFRQVCSAVQYAHQLLIIHRDIKPANILVGADGVPKLLDFGIAKILSEEGEGNAAAAAHTAVAALTPGYASPEQVSGTAITTATDVYSLGVVLYELLTGRRPYRINSGSPQELVRAVCETEPEKPSVAVVSHERAQGSTPRLPQAASPTVGMGNESPDKLRRQLEGDLDNILLMALRKEPIRRYASVDQFSQDIQRHLEHLPVMARNATLAYTARKFAARHRTGVAAALLIALSLVTGFVVAVHEARVARAERARAERRFNDVRDLSNTLLFKIDDSIKNLQGSTEAQHLIITSAQKYLDSLSEEASGDTSLLRELAEGYQKLGLIQGSTRNASLGDPKSAVASLRKAVALREALARANPADRRAQHELQKSYEELADPLIQVDANESAAYIDKSVRLAATLYHEEPTNTDFLHSLILAYQDQAQAFTRRNDFARATTVLSMSLDLAKQLASIAPDASSKLLLSYAHKRLGALMIAQQKYTQALTEYESARALDESLLATHPDNANTQYAITFTYSDIGYIHWKEKDYPQALASYRKVLQIRESLSRADPHDARAISGVARTCRYMGDVLRDEKKPQQALHYDLRQLAIWDQQAAKSTSNPQLQLEICQAKWAIGDDYLAIADTEKDLDQKKQAAQQAQTHLLQAQAAIAQAKKDGMLYGDLVDAPQQIGHDLVKANSLLRASAPRDGFDSTSSSNQ